MLNAGHCSRMSNFPLMGRSHLSGQQGHDRDGLAIQRGELHGIALATVVDQDHRADVAAREALLVQVTGENDIIQLSDHVLLLFRGWAVMNLGSFLPLSINHALRTFKLVPSGASTIPSTTYCVPKGVFSVSTTE